MKKRQPLGKEALISILFTVIVVTAMFVIFLLSGKRQKTADALASSATASPATGSSQKSDGTKSSSRQSASSSAKADSSSADSATAAPAATSEAANKTPKPTAAPTPSPIPFGVSDSIFITSLKNAGIFVAEDTAYFSLSTEDDAVYNHIARLILDSGSGTVKGILFAYPDIDSSVDEDGSAISAALSLANTDAIAARNLSAETVFYAVISSYDSLGNIPLTVRTEWCARYLDFLSDSKHKSIEDTYGKFRFSLYPYGTGQDTLLYCSIQYNG